MNYVGIKELKTNLSSYVARVRNGERIVITDHGQEAGIIIPISEERRLIMSLTKAGKAQWSGNKPNGIKGIEVKGKALSDTILEARE
ncbi:MAG: type II toxin-antitoxin system Phd/YefM family antitoxin [Dissulfurispiraceae bacterium]|jgi:prevent-host-death family protein